MKINDTLKTGLNTKVEKPAPSEGNSTSAVGPSSIAAPTPAQITTLSNQLLALQALQESNGIGPVFDAKKVDMIRSEIESGRFSVDSGKVADGMIKDTIDFLKSK